ncbi:glycoside hydrolase family 65 protein [Legionella impletisoli]|uniref:Glycosyl hydrolase n=1 Tax=Legionella impletisoli TaxID=343510 RepID=A0A917JL28_9GAMM|nr:glycosyl hydrolase family 65 protein [Legionella impletisoli]GGI75479.1 glycosyl hydrolase [Legionella impletisoli]
MIKKTITGLFPTHPWKLTVDRAILQQQLLAETLLAQANGYIGSRGTFEEPALEGIPSCEGVYLNGVYQEEPISYGESAYGFATHNQKMIQVPNGKRITMTLDGEPLHFTEKTGESIRTLDFRNGLLSRTQTWTTTSGKTLHLHSQRFVSLAIQNLMCIRYEITAENFSGPLTLTSSLDAGYDFQVNKDDPRVGRLSIADSLRLLNNEQSAGFNGYLHQVNDSDFVIASVAFDEFSVDVHSNNLFSASSLLEQHYELNLTEGKPVTLYKWIGYSHSRDLDAAHNLLQSLKKTIQQEASLGFEQQFSHHKQVLEDFWHNADVVIEGDEPLQQGIRFNLFHVFQSTGRNGLSNIGAKGLTGHGYDGHYFWDTEIYVIPFLCFTQPELARKLLEFRINTLDGARARAREMAHCKGALYPWRTIGGSECSAYFPAGTAQYHINADIAYALKCYINATEDESLLWQGGAEMLFETARLWLQLGHFNPKREEQFCIDGVTGPDEYTAIVNNNFYTNSMAKSHLLFALEMALRLKTHDKTRFDELAHRIHLEPEELSSWQKAALNMYLPYDEALKIHKQDDGFLDKAVWDFENTPKDKYPLLLHFHPLVIYRHQVLKQADVVLAMYLLDDEYDQEQKKRNLAFYEPLTTHDSSLSSCIHALEFAETGDYETAYDFFADTVRMDLDNHHANSEFGVHIACMAGSWASIIHGFAGFRARKDHVVFNPYLPKQWNSYQFCLRFKDNQLKVTVERNSTHYELIDGQAILIKLGEKMIHLSPSCPIHHEIQSKEMFA